MGLSHDLEAAVDVILAAEEVTLVSHIDADGITSATLLEAALQRAGLPVRTVFVRQLEPFALRYVPREGGLKIFTDVGAGQQNLLRDHGLGEKEVLILDHHVCRSCEVDYPQVNALTHGYTKLSAAGITYLLARTLDPGNRDLAVLAVIGNVGDMMAREDLGLVGPAREIVQDGESVGLIRVIPKDLNCYGISTRPLHVSLAYSDDPYIPGITNDPGAAQRFLQRLGIELRNGADWRVWEELSWEEKRKVISALTQQLLLHGGSTQRLLAETYLFPQESRRSPLRNASEFATLLNACGRWAQPRVGRAVCLGDRGGAYREAEHMLTHHRTVIRDLLRFILDRGVTELSHLQYLDVEERFPDTIVGIGAGMALSKLNRHKPILIMCRFADDPAVTKVSMRTNDEMVRRGIDLQAALIRAAAEVGGEGGGHRIAAGAFIPVHTEEEFVRHVNRCLHEQCPEPGPHHR